MQFIYNKNTRDKQNADCRVFKQPKHCCGEKTQQTSINEKNASDEVMFIADAHSIFITIISIIILKWQPKKEYIKRKKESPNNNLKTFIEG